MVHIIYDTASPQYDAFYIQDGEGLGNGESPYARFQGASPFQRGWGGSRHMTGAGIGDIFRGLWRFFRPILRQAASSAGNETLNTGARVFNAVRSGAPLKDTIVEEGKRGVDNLLEKGGFNRQFGTGGRRRKRTIKDRLNPYSSSLNSHQTLIGKAVNKPIIQTKKRLRSDAFGLY